MLDSQAILCETPAEVQGVQKANESLSKLTRIPQKKKVMWWSLWATDTDFI